MTAETLEKTQSTAQKTRGLGPEQVEVLAELPLREKINRLCTVAGIPNKFVEMPEMITPRYDEEDRMYFVDSNNIVRYYPNLGEVGVVEPTDEFETNNAIAKSPQRELSLEDLY